jgi:hypothetical protein
VAVVQLGQEPQQISSIALTAYSGALYSVIHIYVCVDRSAEVALKVMLLMGKFVMRKQHL